LDGPSGWILNDRLWWTSHLNLANMYSCSSWVTSGCGANTLNTLFMSIDDDGDGTANGTPHAHGIFTALFRHEIACGADGDASNQNHVNTSCPTLAQVVNVTTSAGNNQVVLNWTAVTGATRYDVFRNESGCSMGFTRVGQPTTNTYTDTTVVNGITYYYRVQAFADGGGCSGTYGPVSACVSATPVPCITPGAVSGLVASPAGDNQISLSWINGSPASVAFNVYRAIGACPGSGYTRIATGVPTTSYVDTPVSGQITYAYVVTGVDSTGLCESLYSNCDDAIQQGLRRLSLRGIAERHNRAAAPALNLAWNAARPTAAVRCSKITTDVGLPPGPPTSYPRSPEHSRHEH
jgi:hypothetical protein